MPGMTDKVKDFYQNLQRLLSKKSVIQQIMVKDGNRKLVKIKSSDKQYNKSNSGFAKGINSVAKMQSNAGTINRRQLYLVYDQMEHTPEIASGLDIYSDECLGAETIIPLLNGEKIKLNFIFEEIIDEAKTSLEKEFNLLNKKYIKLDKEMDVLTKNKQDTTEIEEELDSIQKRMSEISSEIEKDSINEAEYQGKKVELGKPKRGGSKKFYVYVRNPKTGKIKKVSFGAKSGGGNLAVKLRDPKARKRFADRHNCEQKNDKTTPGYWSCRLPAYSKLLGLSGGGKWW